MNHVHAAGLSDEQPSLHCTLFGGNNQTLHWLNLKKMNPSSLHDAYDSELLELALLVSRNPALQTVVDRFLQSETSSPEITQASESH